MKHCAEGIPVPESHERNGTPSSFHLSLDVLPAVSLRMSLLLSSIANLSSSRVLSFRMLDLRTESSSPCGIPENEAGWMNDSE